jgi:hypothetical protein
MDWALRTDCIASSIYGSNSLGRYPVGTPEGVRLCCPSLDYQRSCGKTWSSCDNGRCQHVKACSTECCAAHWRLPWNGQRPLRTPIVITRSPLVVHSIICTIWRWLMSFKLNGTGHVFYNIIAFFFSMESPFGEVVLKFVFILYVGTGWTACLPLGREIVYVFNARYLWWPGCVTRMGKLRMNTTF